MSKNRVLYVLIVVAVAVAAAVALAPAVGTKAAGRSGSIDSATRSSMAWAKAVEQQKPASARADRSFHTPQTSHDRPPQQSINCLDGECSYQLRDGRWVK
jgi:hypothetical protein